MNAKVTATMSRPRPLRVLVTNAFSLYSKIGDLLHALITHNVDIAVVTETKMTVDKVTQAEATIPGSAPPIRRGRTAHGGGVAIWVKAGVPHKELDIDTGTQEIILDQYCYQSQHPPRTMCCLSPWLMRTQRYQYVQPNRGRH